MKSLLWIVGIIAIAGVISLAQSEGYLRYEAEPISFDGFSEYVYVNTGAYEEDMKSFKEERKMIDHLVEMGKLSRMEAHFMRADLLERVKAAHKRAGYE